MKYNASTSEINQILGEAYALRAYTYFELINLYAPAYKGTNGSAGNKSSAGGRFSSCDIG